MSRSYMPGMMTLPQLAKKLGFNPDHFRRIYRRLCEGAGMPEPMLSPQKTQTHFAWSSPAIEKWLEGNPELSKRPHDYTDELAANAKRIAARMAGEQR